MLKIKSLLAGTALSLMAASSPAIADDLAIAISPYGEPQAKLSEVQDVIRMMAEVVNPGEKAVIFDGYTGKSICEFDVPDRKSYASEKAKINANRPCIGKLLKFAKTVDSSGTHGTLNIPVALRTIVTTLDMSEIDALIFMGSPIYNDPREPSVSMLNGDYPSDGYITVERARSALSMAGVQGRLQGTPVHFTFDGYDWKLNDEYAASVHRFYWLMTDTVGGPLVTFNNDRKQMINIVKRGIGESAETFERSSSNKLEMINVRPDVGGRKPIHERPLTTEPITLAQRRRALDVEVGITWDCTCDMDIYVRPHPTAEVIYYNNRRTNEGQFYRDYRNGEDLLNGLESVSFYAPVDLDKMVIAVNFYRGGEPKGVTGEIRIAVGDKTYGKPFMIEATTGNEGDGGEVTFNTQSPANDRWLIINGTDVITIQ